MNIKEILEKEVLVLKENNIQEATSKARRLLAFTLGVSKEYLVINELLEVSIENKNVFEAYIARIIEGEPIQYILGTQEFMGIEFLVNKNVLIPQPDTEILVEETIKLAKTMNKPKILDLCTGSGAIAVAIKKYMPEAKVWASDISKEALKIAKQNDKENRIKFIESNLFENIKEKFDIIVSNPPYIKTEEIKTLSKEVQNEPKLALDGGQDGLDFYKKIVKEAIKHLNEDGYLCLEIGEDQREQVTKIIEQTNKYSKPQTIKDLGNNDRVIIVKFIQ